MPPLRLQAPARLDRAAVAYFPRGLLIDPGAGDGDGEVAHAGDDADPLGDTDGAASIEQVEQVRALEAEIVGRKQRKTAALSRG